LIAEYSIIAPVKTPIPRLFESGKTLTPDI